MGRPVILHHHIFKNAGSSLDYALERQFGPSFALFDDPDGLPVEDNALMALLRERPDVQAVSSHHFHGREFAPHPSHQARFLDVGLLRRPMERLVSMYKFYRRAGSLDGVGDLAAEMDARTFVQMLTEEHRYLVNSWQVSILANEGSYAGSITDADLHRAMARYRDFALCGTVERYDEAMVVFEHWCASAELPLPIDLAYVRQNVSEPLEGEGDLRMLLGADVFDWLIGANEHDERLWAFAGAELDRRIERVPRFGRRLAAFRRRCIELERANAALPPTMTRRVRDRVRKTMERGQALAS